MCLAPGVRGFIFSIMPNTSRTPNKGENKIPTTKPGTATLHNLAEDVNHFEQQHGMAPHPLQAQLATHLLWQLDFEQPFVHVLHELTDCMVSLVKLQELSPFPADMYYLVQRLKTLQQLHYFFLECYSSQVLNSQD